MILASLLLHPAQAAEVARVLIVEPGAFVQGGDTEQPLQVRDRLDEEATLVTNDTGVLILQLHNDHLVRIESGLELPVDKLAMLHSPRSKRTVSEQLDALLYPDERERLGPMVTSAEGMGGWHGRLTAAVAPVGDVDARGGGGGDDATVRGALPARVPRQPGSDEFDLAGEAGDAEESAPATFAAVVDLYQPGAARHSCVAAWSEQLAIHLLTDTLTLTPVIAEGKVARLQVQGAYPIPLCLRDGLVGQPAPTEVEAVTIQLK